MDGANYATLDINISELANKDMHRRIHALMQDTER